MAVATKMEAAATAKRATPRRGGVAGLGARSGASSEARSRAFSASSSALRWRTVSSSLRKGSPIPRV